MFEILMEQGFVVMLTGVGVVFAFLAVLVIAMNIMAVIIAKLNELFPVKAVEVASSGAKSTADKSAGEDIAVAIAVALSRR